MAEIGLELVECRLLPRALVVNVFDDILAPELAAIATLFHAAGIDGHHSHGPYVQPSLRVVFIEIQSHAFCQTPVAISPERRLHLATQNVVLAATARRLRWPVSI